MQQQIDHLYASLEAEDPLAISAALKNIQVKVSAHYFDFIQNKNIIRLSLKHSIYAGDMINSFQYYFEAVEPIIFNGFNFVDYSLPAYHDVIGFDIMPVFFPSLAEPISTTEQYLNFAKISPGSTVIDLGAYSGLTSIIFKERAGSTGRVIAVDADKQNIVAIQKNLSLYQRITGRGIELYHRAIWNNNKGLSFSSEGNMGSSASEIVGFGRGENDVIASITLSKLAEISDIETIDFIKCDVEGAEAVIFQDDIFFQKFNPRIIIETHWTPSGETTNKCISDLGKYGYSCKRIEQYGVVLPLLECYPREH